MRTTKYNVSTAAAGRTYDGIVFDSAMEMRYYRDIVVPSVADGTIAAFERQKPFELQPKFKHGTETIRAITYVADFFIEYRDGHTEVIEIKGCPDSTALLKRRLFLYKFPDLTLRWITYSGIDGGWCEYQTVAANRRKRKKLKTQN